jgi:hypothetical protein
LLRTASRAEGLNRITKIKSFGASRADGLNRITKINSFGASRAEDLNRKYKKKVVQSKKSRGPK